MVYRLYLIKPSALTTTLTSTELNSYGDYPNCPSDYTTVKYLYVNCEEFSFPEDKKVKITRYAGRGSISIDLREIFSTFVAKNIYLGNIFSNTYAKNRVMAWKYAHNEWNKLTGGKTGIKLIQCELNTNDTVTGTPTEITDFFKVFKSSSFSNLTLVWNKQLPIDVDHQGNVMIKQIELEERL